MINDKLATATIGGAFGVKGYVKVFPFSGETKHIAKLKEVTLVKGEDTKSLVVDGCELRDGLALVHFKGYDNPEIAKSLSGYVLWIDRKQAPKLRKGEHYVADLMGLSVVHEGLELGKVVGVIEGLQGLLLEIRTEKENHFVPYLDRFFGEVDLQAGTLEILQTMVLA